MFSKQAPSSKSAGEPSAPSPSTGELDREKAAIRAEGAIPGSTWDSIRAGLKGRSSFQQSLRISLGDASGQHAVELRFCFLVSRNGFKRIAEVCAISFQKVPGRETAKTALRQSFDASTFAPLASGGFRLANCEFSPSHTRGTVQSKGQSLSWDLELAPRQPGGFDLIPGALRNAALAVSSFASTEADAIFQGSSTVNGQKTEWQSAPGMVERVSGPISGQSWIWAHGNHFVNEQGVPIPFIFEGITLRGHVFGMLPTPRFSSFQFVFKGKLYSFNTLRDAVRMKSRFTLNEWHFHAERGELVFRGHAKVEHKDFAGITLEDTHGSLHYCATSKLADLDIHVYRRGKLESALRAERSASLETVSPRKNPYVPLLI